METGASERPQDWEAEIRSLEQESRRAFLERDIESLERLFSDDMIVNSPIHRVWRSEGGSWRLIVRQATLIG